MTRLFLPLVVLAGCGPDFISDNDTLAFTARGDAVDFGNGVTPNPILAGSVVCPLVTCIGPDCPSAGRDVSDCFDQAGTGSVAVRDDGCLEFTGAGAGSWTLEPRECAMTDYKPVADSVQFDVIGPDKVTGTVAQVEDLALDLGFTPGVGQRFPKDWVNPPGEPFRIVEGGRYMLIPRLEGADGGPVGWSKTNVSASLDSGGQAQGALARFRPGGRIEVVATDGLDATVLLDFDDAEIPVADVIDVDRTDARSLQVVVAYWTDPAGMGSTPIAARAVVRDGDGNLIYGAPVRWSLNAGRLSLHDAVTSGLPGPDYLRIADACEPQRIGDGHAVLVARYNGLVATQTVDWTQAPLKRPTPTDCVEGHGVIGGTGPHR
jgi:hypothetical protein